MNCSCCQATCTSTSEGLWYDMSGSNNIKAISCPPGGKVYIFVFLIQAAAGFPRSRYESLLPLGPFWVNRSCKSSCACALDSKAADKLANISSGLLDDLELFLLSIHAYVHMKKTWLKAISSLLSFAKSST